MLRNPLVMRGFQKNVIRFWLLLLGAMMALSASLYARASTPEVDLLYSEARKMHAAESALSTNAKFQAAVDLYSRYSKTRSALPYILSHGAPTKNVAILFHGFTMEPSATREMAKILYDKGFNVIAPVLEAHSPDGLTMLKVTREDWQADGRFALDIASLLGDHVYMGGYSLGGLVSIDTDLHYPGEISGLILVAPPIWLKPKFSSLACVAKAIINNSTAAKAAYRYNGHVVNPVERDFFSGTCPLRSLIEDVVRTVPEEQSRNLLSWYPHMKQVYSRIRVPVYLAYSESDEAVDSRMLRFFANSLPKTPIIQLYPKSMGVYHVRSFEMDIIGSAGKTMKQSLSEFIDTLP